MRFTAVRALVGFAVCVTAFGARAMPNFARREGFDCSTCHTNIPRLNRFGYEYRNAGFRVPSTIGDKKQKDQPDFGTMNSARLQSDAEWHHERDETKARKTTNQGQLTFLEATLYPITGSFGRWWSSEGELSVAPDEFFEVENAYLRYTDGNEMIHCNIRAGVFHPWEGYGASDRPMSLARPTFQTTPARWIDDAGLFKGAAGTTFFKPWGFDQAGIEAGVTYGPFNVAATLFNGLLVEDGSAEPFQGGDLKRKTSDPAYTTKDFQAFGNVFIGDAAVAVHYYHGTLRIPVDTASFLDRFDKLSFYGTLPLEKYLPKPIPPVWVLAGFEHGWDDGFNVSTNEKTSSIGSQGWFGELYFPFTPKIGGSARYDYFDSSRRIKDNTQHAVTAAINAAALNGVQGILEYRHVLTELNATNNKNRDQLEARLIYIF